jgi:hypothetical protein
MSVKSADVMADLVEWVGLELGVVEGVGLELGEEVEKLKSHCKSMEGLNLASAW